jgi:hypothetical protein
MIKFKETLFCEYINSSVKNIHKNIFNSVKLPLEIANMTNIIIYGSPGIGKYTISLNIINKYSKSNLKYEKKITVSYNKYDYILKFSDMHYEIDMELLGCNSKLLWHELFTTINEIIMAKNNKCGIILCKNFSTIHNDLLNVFYNYMQQINNMKNVKMYFIILTTSISFIPQKIINNCIVIPAIKQSNYIIKKQLLNNNPDIRIDNKELINLKNIKDGDYTNINNPVKNKCNIIINTMINIKNNTDPHTENTFAILRNELYDLLIYNLNICDCLWYITKTLAYKKYINSDNISNIIINIYTFLKYYNNNYRPIYHLEKIVIYIISQI